MSREPGREQNWYPVSKLGWFTGHIREGVEATCRQLELLQPARARPYVLDDATVARIIRVHRDQAGDLTLFQNQAGRRKTDPGLTDAQRAGIAAYETLIAQLAGSTATSWPWPQDSRTAPSRRCWPNPTCS